MATSAGSRPSKDLLEPGDGNTEGHAKSVHLGSRSYWGKCSDFVRAFDFGADKMQIRQNPCYEGEASDDAWLLTIYGRRWKTE